MASYILSAMILGVFFALQSGTVDSIVYDTLLEETGTADGYQTHFGRIQMWNSAALTGSALLGGVIAGLTTPRMAYLITVPFAAAGLLLLLRFREPTLHRQAARAGIRQHLIAMWRAVAGRPRVAVIILASVLVGATMQMVFEFGPLWLLAAGVATVMFGPYTAGLTATIGIHLSQLLHDAVPSDMRTGVASGVSTLSWITFLPCSLLFGAVSRHGGIHAAGWIVLALLTIAGLALTSLAVRRPAARATSNPCGRTEPVALAAA